MAEESTLAGYYSPTTDLHLHPRLVRKSLILHELAHWIKPRPRDGEGHGDDFVEIFAALVALAFGAEAAETLRAYVLEARS